MADDVSLPDLEVISRFSLAVRAATAPRDEVVAALQADLEWLTGSATPTRAARKAPARPRKASSGTRARKAAAEPKAADAAE